jgi:hypothetical protein
LAAWHSAIGPLIDEQPDPRPSGGPALDRPVRDRIAEARRDKPVGRTVTLTTEPTLTTQLPPRRRPAGRQRPRSRTEPTGPPVPTRLSPRRGAEASSGDYTGGRRIASATRWFASWAASLPQSSSSILIQRTTRFASSRSTTQVSRVERRGVAGLPEARSVRVRMIAASTSGGLRSRSASKSCASSDNAAA